MRALTLSLSPLRRGEGTVLAILASLLVSSSALATSTAPTSLTGRVTTAGEAAAGVTVTATSPSLQGERTTVTTASGRYWLTALPPGEYEVTFSRGGLQTLIKSAVVELSRVTRVDAALEPSADEERVTSTAKVVGVADTTLISSHYSDQTLDRLPFRRDPGVPAFLAPGSGGGLPIRDDALTFTGGAQDAIEQVTVLRGALPADADFFPPVVTARTRAGGEDFYFSLRDTLTNPAWDSEVPFLHSEDGLHQLFEATGGGRIVPEKLWFFAGAWHGSELYFGDHRGFTAKLTGQPGAEHNLTALYEDTEIEQDPFNPQADLATLRYIGSAGPRWTNEAVVSHTSLRSVFFPAPGAIPTVDHDSFFVKSTCVLGTRFGDHILSAGGAQVNDEFYDETAFFANDRWVWNRATFNLGLRHQDDKLLPRLAASFDLRGDGRHAIQATFSDYIVGFSEPREYTIGFATALGNGGSARVDGIRRDYGPVSFDSVQFELRYSLFDRLQAAANYTWLGDQDSGGAGAPAFPNHVANAWVTIALPVGLHEFAVTVLERFRSEVAEPFGSEFMTDVALRYSLPVRRVGLTLAVDVTNVFDQQQNRFVIGRAARGWIRLRL